MTTTPEIDEIPQLRDYCKRCEIECGCGRWDTLTEPFEVHWPGPGAVLTARYRCGCGHEWTCHWSSDWLALHGGKGE